jgi:large repetitive protein
MTSKPVSVTILPPVTGNTISGDPVLCYMDSPELSGVSDLSGGDGEFSYKWESAGNDLNWEPAAGSANNPAIMLRRSLIQLFSGG